MGAAVVGALVLCAASVLVGQALLVALSERGWSWLCGAVGIATLLSVGGFVNALGGGPASAAIVLAALCAAAALVLWRAGLPRPRLGMVALVTAGAGALAVIPFLVAGRVGVLGAGLVNDDMASHLVMADWLRGELADEPKLIADGYPLGPHSLVTALAEATGIGLVEAFAALSLAVAVMTAWSAAHALGGARSAPAAAGAVLVALSYLGAAYLAQGAFKEPLLAMLVLAFSLLVAGEVGGRRQGRGAGRAALAAVPAGLVASGALYAYSFPALFWLGGAAVTLGALALLRGSRWPSRWALRLVGAGCASAAAVAVALNAPELGRMMRFAGFKAFDPGTDGLGNLGQPLSPFEALGIWPASDFRLAADDATVPALVFYAGAALALALLLRGLVRSWQAGRLASLAGLAAAAVIYAGSAATVTAYAGAKALAIAAPFAMLVIVQGILLAPGVWTRPGRAPRAIALAGLAALFVMGAAASTLLVLRGAAVGADAHPGELDRLRTRLGESRVLFLGRDNFVLHNLRGSKPHTHVRNYYNPYFAPPNPEVRAAGSKFGFDAVSPRTLSRFPYVITTRAEYTSGPPPGYDAVAATDSYVLWRRGPLGEREAVERGAAPGATVRCGRSPARGRHAVFAGDPVVAPQEAWHPAAELEDGAPSELSLDLPRGRWRLSMQYDSTQPVTVSAAGEQTVLPPNLDYRGVAPFWAAGGLTVRGGGPTAITVGVEAPTLAGRLLGASAVAHLGGLAATPVGPGYSEVAPPGPGASELVVPGARACSEYADWRTG